MDNQQVTKDWFVGFLEGEGCFSAKRRQHDCVIRITNKEVDVLYACQKYLSQNGILSYILKRKDSSQAYDVYISGFNECNILYHSIKDSMSCRIKELESIIGSSTIPRETSSNLNWLAGVLEAEGHFTIKTQWSKDDRVSYKPFVDVPNTNPLIIEKVVKTLYTNGLAWYVYNGKNSGYKDYQRISIVGFKRVNRFLEVMENLWIGRKTVRKIKLLKEFCHSRLNKEPKAQYSNREHEIALEIKMKI